MFACKNVYAVWDKRLIRGVKNYRRTHKSVEYKANRDVKRNEKVFSHEDRTTEYLNALGVKNMYPGILEADDVIYWLAKHTPGTSVVVSVDQDMLQLVDEDVTVYSPIKDILIDKANFHETQKVPLSDFLRYKSLMGDKSDNLPGVDRCGNKTAQKLVNDCPTDELLIEKLGEEKLKPYFINLEMIDLREGIKKHPDDVKLYQDQYENLKSHECDFSMFVKKCKEANFNRIITNSHDWKKSFCDVNLTSRLQDIVKSLDLDK